MNILRILLVIISLFTFINGYGQFSIEFNKINGGMDKYGTEVIKTITFDPGFINVKTDTSYQSYLLNDVKSITIVETPASTVDNILTFENTFHIYPNPVSLNEVYVSLDLNKSQEIIIVVHNSKGAQVLNYSKIFAQGVSTTQIDLGEFGKGIYLVTLYFDTKQHSKKLMKL